MCLHVTSACLFTCEYVCAIVHERMSGVNLRCWSSYSTGIETRTLSLLSLVVHCCEWQDSSLGSIQKFSCVYFSSHYMHVNITNVDITHSFAWALEIWNSAFHACPSRALLPEPSSPQLQHRQNCHLNVELMDLARLAGRQVPHIHHLCLPGPEISSMNTASLLLGCWGFKLRPSYFQEDTFTTELALRLS